MTSLSYIEAAKPLPAGEYIRITPDSKAFTQLKGNGVKIITSEFISQSLISSEGDHKSISNGKNTDMYIDLNRLWSRRVKIGNEFIHLKDKPDGKHLIEPIRKLLSDELKLSEDVINAIESSWSQGLFLLRTMFVFNKLDQQLYETKINTRMKAGDNEPHDVEFGIDKDEKGNDYVYLQIVEKLCQEAVSNRKQTPIPGHSITRYRWDPSGQYKWLYTDTSNALLAHLFTADMYPESEITDTIKEKWSEIAKKEEGLDSKQISLHTSTAAVLEAITPNPALVGQSIKPTMVDDYFNHYQRPQFQEPSVQPDEKLQFLNGLNLKPPSRAERFLLGMKAGMSLGLNYVRNLSILYIIAPIIISILFPPVALGVVLGGIALIIATILISGIVGGVIEILKDKNENNVKLEVGSDDKHIQPHEEQLKRQVQNDEVKASPQAQAKNQGQAQKQSTIQVDVKSHAQSASQTLATDSHAHDGQYKKVGDDNNEKTTLKVSSTLSPVPGSHDSTDEQRHSPANKR